MTLPAILAILIFVTIALAAFAFGAAAYAPSSILGARLRSLAFQRPQAQQLEKPAIKQRLEQALDPLSKALPLSPSDTDRTRGWLIQAGYREPRHLTIYVGSRLLLAMVAMLLPVVIQGSFDLLLMIGVG